MNPGSEPERDDTGLPPVDIEIPDDARDLDRDVQAYYRELRAHRRSKRRIRWHRSLGRDSILLPLLACCLILALITGTLLTVFTATAGQNRLTGPGARTAHPPAASRAPSGQPRPGASSQPASPVLVTKPTGSLPDAILQVVGSPAVHVSTLSNAMLVLVPSGCACSSTLRWLAEVAGAASATAYLIYTPLTQAEVEQLDRHLGSAAAALTLAEDKDNLLASQGSFPQGIVAGQLNAILLSPLKRVTYASDLSPTENPKELIDAMTLG